MELAPAIPGWENMALASAVEAAFGAPVRLATDVKAAATAEARWGALAGYDPAIYLNLGTGLGAAIVVGGRVVKGAHGASGEIGYNLVDAGDAGLEIAARPILEDTVSGMGLAASGSRLLGRLVTAGEVFDGAQADPRLGSLITALIRQLSAHLVNLVIAVDPARVAIGGGMARSWERLQAPLEQALKSGVPYPPELVLAAYPFDAPLVGALALGAEVAGADLAPRGSVYPYHNPEGERKTNMKRRWLGTLLLGPAVHGPGPDGDARQWRAQHRHQSGILTISNEGGSLWPCSFNPYNPAVWGQSVGFFYEPLVYVNTLENGKATPWLATSWAWSDGNKVLTFTIRKGVKWSDGVPMTAADVAFTFNLLKANPALDLNSIWSVLKSVSPERGQRGAHLQDKPPCPTFIYVADQVDVLPQHVWASVKNAVTYNDASPVGTGPYTLSQVHGPEHHLHGQPQLLATGPAQGEDDRVPGVYLKHAGQRGAGHRSGPARGASSSPTSRPFTLPRAPATTTGSRP